MANKNRKNKGSNGVFIGNHEMIAVMASARARLEELKKLIPTESEIDMDKLSPEEQEMVVEYNLLAVVYSRIVKYIRQGRNPYVELTQSEKPSNDDDRQPRANEDGVVGIVPVGGQ